MDVYDTSVQLFLVETSSHDPSHRLGRPGRPKAKAKAQKARRCRRPQSAREKVLGLQEEGSKLQWEILRILKWRYYTIFLAIFWGYIPLYQP